MRAIKRCGPKLNLKRLQYPNVFLFNSAQGWLELGSPTEALGELDKMPSTQWLQPDVLYLRWRILAELCAWRRCLVVARTLIQQSPEAARGWLALARTWRGKGELAKAYATCVAQSKRFPHAWQLQYDAACYGSLLGKKDEAREFLALAMVAGDARSIRRRARQDPDLKWLFARRTSKKR